MSGSFGGWDFVWFIGLVGNWLAGLFAGWLAGWFAGWLSIEQNTIHDPRRLINR